jgi:hypothetical protein
MSSSEYRGPALGTRHSALGTRHSALGTRHSALGTRYSVLGTRYSALSTSNICYSHREHFNTRKFVHQYYSDNLASVECRVPNIEFRASALGTRHSKQWNWWFNIVSKEGDMRSLGFNIRRICECGYVILRTNYMMYGLWKSTFWTEWLWLLSSACLQSV